MFVNKLAISSLSWGQHPSHLLDDKIRVAASHGFEGIEIVFSDIEEYARTKHWAIASGQISSRNMRSTPHRNLVTGSVPAQYSGDCTGEEKVIVFELQQLADLARGEQPVVAVAYEPMSWSTHCSTWQTALHIAEAVNRSNFGLCIDSFHEATKHWASPFKSSGKLPNADNDLRGSLRAFREQCPLDKVFYVQLSDAERFDPPFPKSHPWYLEGEAPQFTWSRHARPFPLEADLGGYLPLSEVLQNPG
ncbi:hypothetical protein BBP40_010893 [Aspergillus hancockii]|nr:hypothetical protein BBP40_010893 [Aspergillus hancockii]